MYGYELNWKRFKELSLSLSTILSKFKQDLERFTGTLNNATPCDLIRHSERHGCEFLRGGADHTVCVNRSARKCSTLPRYRDIIDFTAEALFL